MNSAAILSAMLRLAPFSADHFEPSEREALYLPIARAIATVAKTPEEAAALISDGWHESKFSRAVLTGQCSGHQCDKGKARGAWQVWAWCKATDATGEARCVLSQMRLGLERCGAWEGAFGALTGSWSCVSMPARVQTQRQVLAYWGNR